MVDGSPDADEALALMAINDHPDFRALEPFFRIIEEGVAGLVDGERYFEMLADDVVFEYIITVPAYPRRVQGRQAVADLYRPYGSSIVLERCYDLAVPRDSTTGVIVLEYASEGSVRTITDRAITHGRDYLDPIAVFQALGWPDTAHTRTSSTSAAPTSVGGCSCPEGKSSSRFGAQRITTLIPKQVLTADTHEP